MMKIYCDDSDETDRDRREPSNELMIDIIFKKYCINEKSEAVVQITDERISDSSNEKL